MRVAVLGGGLGKNGENILAAQRKHCKSKVKGGRK